MRSYCSYIGEVCYSFFKKIVFAVFVIFLFPVVGFAATLSFSPASGTYQEGSVVTVGVVVNSGGAALNAVSGVVAFPSDLLEVTSVSKNQSIVSLWVQEPSFSNTAGTINFEGIVLNPGYIGTNGRVLNINFKVKAGGQIPLTFTSGSVLANDGEGSEILSGRGSATYQVIPVAVPELSDPETPVETAVASNPKSVPKVSSDSHSLDGWSNKKDGIFNFALTSDVTALRLLVDDVPDSLPVVVYSPPVASREIKDLNEGLSYLHVQYRTAEGWGDILHYKLQIDTIAPESFSMKMVDSSNLLLESKDKDSGISVYEIQIDGGEWVKFIDDGSHIYRLPLLSPGNHKLLAKAFDQAGNFTVSALEFITPEPVVSLEVPKVSEVPVPVTEKAFFHNGAILITVLSVIVPCLALILLLGALLFFTWRSVGGLRKRINKEVLEAKTIVHKAFSLLKTDLEEDINTLKKASKKRKLTREESKILKRLQVNLDEAEKIITKEVTDIEEESSK